MHRDIAYLHRALNTWPGLPDAGMCWYFTSRFPTKGDLMEIYFVLDGVILGDSRGVDRKIHGHDAAKLREMFKPISLIAVAS
jgi:hypothetical protein